MLLFGSRDAGGAGGVADCGGAEVSIQSSSWLRCWLLGFFLVWLAWLAVGEHEGSTRVWWLPERWWAEPFAGVWVGQGFGSRVQGGVRTRFRGLSVSCVGELGGSVVLSAVVFWLTGRVLGGSGVLSAFVSWLTRAPSALGGVR